MTIQIGKHMTAEPLGCEPHEAYTLYARDGVILGHVEWYRRWRGYIFSPDDDIALSWDCCMEMGRFLKNCNKATRVVTGRRKT